ncbi:hypothetical protein WMY93_016819 [Mugilogobius chulae]|uniref:PDZ domain-containing protein n=1 Tax=Mugilogobius chulae TaxID=88201 RepID=A0AAW0NWP0_9GOBI
MPEEKGVKREELSRVIDEWNRSRLDLFEISPPDQKLEFHGVMRFYLENCSGQNVATKCLRVSSVWTTDKVLHLLSQKISPDLNMLSSALWIWEVQAHKERRLQPEERPLVVQLNWNKNNREGRFVLKSDKDRGEKENSGDKVSLMQNFRRSLSKKDKKKLKNRSTEKPLNTAARRQTEVQRHLHSSKNPEQDHDWTEHSLYLPIAVEFTDNTEDSLLCAVINYTNSSTVHFKLSPASSCTQPPARCSPGVRTKEAPANFLLDPQTHGALPKGIELVLNTLMTSMSLLRRCKVHPALSIQLFSQLFHYISAWLFNRLLAPHTDPAALRSHQWGATLRHRLTPIEAWAERQGLELAADCHLGLILQATALLTMEPSVEVHEAQRICFRLSPAQIQALLLDYSYAPHQRNIPSEWIAGLVSMAKASSDLNPDVSLEESLTLLLPLLLPEQGYCSQTLRGVHQDSPSLWSRSAKEPQTSGDWTVHFNDTGPSSETTYLEPHRQLDVESVTLNKPLNSGMGLSIVAAKGAGQNELGIYIKSIVRGGPAEMNGRLSCGDQLLSVDGHSLIGLSQESAAETLMQTGPVVTLKVAKCAAGFHGLEELLQDKTQDKESGKNYRETKHRTKNPAELSSSNRKHRESKLQRNRQLYRSNPNILHLVLEEEEETCEPKLRQNKMTTNSTINLCSGLPNAQREYGTLPNPRNKDTPESNQPSTLRQPATTRPTEAHSRHTHMTSAVPLLLPAAPELLHAGRPLPDKPRTPKSPGTPFHQHQPFTCATSIQPIRIDIPLTRTAHSNPTLTTFQSPSQHKVSTPKCAKMRQIPFTTVQQMEQEVLRLQVKSRRSAEENERLKRLSLEFEFQKRLKEMEDGEREEKRNSKQTVSNISWKDDQGTTDGKNNKQNANDKAADQKAEDNMKAPEKLTFRERQQLFSLASSA